MVPRWLLVALVVCSPAALAAQPHRVVVVIVGDPGGAASLGEVVERRLAAVASVQSVGIAHVAPPSKLAVDKPARPSETPRTQLAAAIDRFYANRIDDALADLAAIESALDPGPASYALRRELALWRAAVLERQWTNSGRAEPVPEAVRDAARVVLHLDPDVQVRMETFWPRFAELIENERRALARHVLHLRSLPTGARAWLDGRPIGRRVEVTPGRYRLHIAAEGFVARAETLDIHADLELVRPLSWSVPPDIAAAIGEAMARGDADQTARHARHLAAVDHADVIVVIAAEPDHGRGAVVHGAAPQRSPRLEHGPLVDWVARAVTREEGRAAWRWQLTARLGFASTGTSLSWGDSEILSERSGGGLSLELSGQRSQLLTRFDVRVDHDAVVSARSRGIESSPTSAHAGWLATAGFRVGTRVGGERISLVPWLRVAMRSHRTGALVFPGGEDPLTSEFTAIGLGLAATLRVQLTSRVAIELAVAVDPLAGYFEKPERGTANPPEVAAGSSLVAVLLGSGWIGELGASYDRVEIQYVGLSPAIVMPAPVDARRLDETFLFWVGARHALNR